MPNNIDPSLWKSISMIAMALFAALAGYLHKIRKASKEFDWKELVSELIVSLFCGFVAWHVALWANISSIPDENADSMVILIVIMATFAGSKSADFFEGLYFSIIEQLAKTRVKKND